MFDYWNFILGILYIQLLLLKFSQFNKKFLHHQTENSFEELFQYLILFSGLFPR